MIRRSDVILLFVFFQLCLLMIFLPAVAEYTYNIDDSIPHDVQNEAYLYASSQLIDNCKKSKYPLSQNQFLEKYLQYYGIFIPCELDDIHVWLQNELTRLDRVKYIPERYSSTSEVKMWINRYAEAGDILLYKANGRADRCLIFAGNGKYIGRNFNGDFGMIDVPSTFVSGDYSRKQSSGLYAVGHIWFEERNPGENVIEARSFFIRFITDCNNNERFSAFTFTLYELDSESSDYVRSHDRIIFEKFPGTFVLWDGHSDLLSEEYIELHNGLHIMLEVNDDNNSVIPQKIKIDLMPNEITRDMEILLPGSESCNEFQYDGEHILELIKESGP